MKRLFFILVSFFSVALRAGEIPVGAEGVDWRQAFKSSNTTLCGLLDAGHHEAFQDRLHTAARRVVAGCTENTGISYTDLDTAFVRVVDTYRWYPCELEGLCLLPDEAAMVSILDDFTTCNVSIYAHSIQKSFFLASHMAPPSVLWQQYGSGEMVYKALEAVVKTPRSQDARQKVVPRSIADRLKSSIVSAWNRLS